MTAIYFGQDPQEITSAGMILTPHDLKRIEAKRLKGESYPVEGGFRCMVWKKGNCAAIGDFKSVDACNAAYGNYQIDEQIKKIQSRLNSRGYQTNNWTKTQYFQVIMPDGTCKSYKTPEKARAVFEKIIAKQVKDLEKQKTKIPKSEYI